MAFLQETFILLKILKLFCVPTNDHNTEPTTTGDESATVKRTGSAYIQKGRGRREEEEGRVSRERACCVLF